MLTECDIRGQCVSNFHAYSYVCRGICRSDMPTKSLITVEHSSWVLEANRNLEVPCPSPPSLSSPDNTHNTRSIPRSIHSPPRKENNNTELPNSP